MIHIGTTPAASSSPDNTCPAATAPAEMILGAGHSRAGAAQTNNRREGRTTDPVTGLLCRGVAQSRLSPLREADPNSNSLKL